MYLKIAKVIVFVFIVHVQAEKCTTPNNEEGECVPLHSCCPLFSALQTNHNSSVEEFITASICSRTPFFTIVCCGASPNFSPKKTNTYSQKSLLPDRKFCGYQHADDYYRAENDTSVRINEFPWIAQILKPQTVIPAYLDKVPVCSGSLINRRYVLTSGNRCLNGSVLVRLGEYNNHNKTDCIQDPPFDEECSDGVEDFGIEERIPHPTVDGIALIRLNRSVSYSDYIRPICLPSSETRKFQIGDVLIASGWGLSIKKEQIAKKKVYHRIISKEECTNSSQGSNEYDTCTRLLSNNTDTACLGDQGGPIMFADKIQWYQLGIMQHLWYCDSEFPRVHIQIMDYVNWIVDTIRP